jgi:hypothetical protein
VLGGRSFDQGSRVHQARHNMHVFGVVEGEDDLILMGMVKDVTDSFTTRYMAGMLGVIQSINEGPDGKPLPPAQRLLRLSPATLFTEPKRMLQATVRLLTQGAFWLLVLWIVANLLREVLLLPLRLLPTRWLPRYQLLPPELRGYARFAETRLGWLRWAYLGINLHFQLELTRAQIRRIAALQCEQLRTRVKGTSLLTGLWQMDRLRRLVGAVGDDLEQGTCTLVAGTASEPFAHPFDAREKKPKG